MWQYRLVVTDIGHNHTKAVSRGLEKKYADHLLNIDLKITGFK